jgi:hypothetical protein
MAARPYVVVDSDDPEKLVAYLVQSATSQSQAIQKVVAGRYTARAAAPADLLVALNDPTKFARIIK